MNLQQQLKEKNYFLRKAYEAAYEHAPSSPLSVSLNPIEFGKSIGFDNDQTTRIMNELIAQHYVQSSIGMGMLLVTQAGLKYLTRIEDEPLTPLDNLVKKDNNIPTPNQNPNAAFMKQTVKFDLILKELYKHKNDGLYYSIGGICNALNIPVDSDMEINKLGHRLKNDGLINTMFKHNDVLAELTSHGIDYCEDNSYSNPGHSVITNNYHVSVVNSSNVNVVNESSNVTITQNISEADHAIEQIREALPMDHSISQDKATEILECLNEIQLALKNNQKSKYSIKSLLDIAGGIASIASWVTVLAQYAGIIQLP